MANNRPEARIEVTTHGPYEVSGDVELRPKTIIRAESGDAITWKVHDEIAHPRTYYLCRCGQSENKPFCDGCHAFDLFDGTETAPTNRYKDRAVTHEGPGINLIRDPGLCQHAGFCTNQQTTWLEMVPETGDHQVRVQLTGMLEHCPSGSLSYEVEDETIEPSLGAVVAPVTDGPLFVSGGITLERSDEEPIEVRNRVTLCRCGGSSNKPFCDGSHYYNEFEAPHNAD